MIIYSIVTVNTTIYQYLNTLLSIFNFYFGSIEKLDSKNISNI